jgi:hypothetical protein
MEAGRVGGQVADGQGDQWTGSTQPLVVGRGSRQVGEQVAQPPADQPQPAPLGAAAEQDLGHGQTHQLGIAELGRPAGPTAWANQVVDHDIECNDEGVEVGVHEASQEVDVASATPTLGPLAPVVTARHPQADSEAII